MIVDVLPFSIAGELGDARYGFAELAELWFFDRAGDDDEAVALEV